VTDAGMTSSTPTPLRNAALAVTPMVATIPGAPKRLHLSKSSGMLIAIGANTSEVLYVTRIGQAPG
jgi:hypothetical protein